MATTASREALLEPSALFAAIEAGGRAAREANTPRVIGVEQPSRGTQGPAPDTTIFRRRRHPSGQPGGGEAHRSAGRFGLLGGARRVTAPARGAHRAARQAQSAHRVCRRTESRHHGSARRPASGPEGPGSAPRLRRSVRGRRPSGEHYAMSAASDCAPLHKRSREMLRSVEEEIDGDEWPLPLGLGRLPLRRLHSPRRAGL